MARKLQFQVKDPKKGLFKQYIHQRIFNKNNSYNFALTGPTGSGKSYSSLSLGYQWDANFTEDNIVFTAKDFVALLNSGKLKRGSFILFEEAGVSLNNREWMSKSNNFIQKIFQTVRHKGYIICFTVPDFGFVDSATRKLFHGHFMTNGIDHKNKLCITKPYQLQTDQRTGNVYFKWLEVIMKGVGSKKISVLKISMPPKDLIKKYELKKTAFTTKLNNEIEEAMNQKSPEELKADKVKAKELEQKKKQWSAIDKLRKKSTPWNEIAELFSFTSGPVCSKWYKRNESVGN